MESKKVEELKAVGNRENKPPKHEMVVFKGLMSEKRAFGDFRTVLHTGLYSQIVAMEVPVGGEIGDEVGSDCPVFRRHQSCLRRGWLCSSWIRSC